jgi:hypothetical protein
MSRAVLANSSPWTSAYPSLGPAAFFAWAAPDDDSDQSARAAAIAKRYMESAPTLRLGRSTYRIASHMPARWTPAWRPGSAVAAGATLGWVMLGLEGRVPEALFRQMARALAACYDDAQRVLRLEHYINGNYQIPLCELAFLHARINGSDGGDDEYERCLEFLCSADKAIPRGQGLQLVLPPDGSDWRRAVGYFSEIEGIKGVASGNSFDGEYTQLQLDYMTRLWLLTRDERILQLSNALINAILPLTDLTTWQADCRAGSRRNNVVPFWNAGLATLAFHDPRPEFTDQVVRSQFTTAIDEEYRRRADAGTVTAYCLRGYGLALLGTLVSSSPALFDHPSLGSRMNRKE